MMKTFLISSLIAIATLLFNACNSPTDDSVKIRPGYFPATNVSTGKDADQSYVGLETTRLGDGRLVVGLTCWTVDTLYYGASGSAYYHLPDCTISDDSMALQLHPWICGTGLTRSVSSKKCFTYQLEREKELSLLKIVFTGYGYQRLEIDKITP